MYVCVHMYAYMSQDFERLELLGRGAFGEVFSRECVARSIVMLAQDNE